MRISKINQIILVGTAIITTSHAAVITNSVITDFTGATGSYGPSRPLGVSITGDNAVYLVGTMNVTSTVASLGNSFNEANLGLGAAHNTGFGHGFGNDNIVITRDGTQATVVGQTFTQSVPVFFVLKLNQTNGVSTLWVNPNLSTTEALNPVGATATVAAVNGSTFDSVIFRGGDFDPAGPLDPPINPSVFDYTGFSVHYGGDTPFSAIPEPSSALLLSLAGLVIGRRRR